jgi:hypothetical protein
MNTILRGRKIIHSPPAHLKADETEHNTVPFAWIAVSLIAVIGVFIGISVLKDEFSDSDSD